MISVGFKKGRSPLPSSLGLNGLPPPNRPQMNLAEYHVPGSKDTYYIPDFVTTDEETYLLRKVSFEKPLNHPLHVDSGDTTAEMEATFESEVCYVLNESFSVSTYAPGCRHGVTSKPPLLTDDRSN
jgi:hypothetical protein